MCWLTRGIDVALLPIEIADPLGQADAMKLKYQGDIFGINNVDNTMFKLFQTNRNTYRRKGIVRLFL